MLPDHTNKRVHISQTNEGVWYMSLTVETGHDVIAADDTDNGPMFIHGGASTVTLPQNHQSTKKPAITLVQGWC